MGFKYPVEEHVKKGMMMQRFWDGIFKSNQLLFDGLFKLKKICANWGW
jgi:hypothetical protein